MEFMDHMHNKLPKKTIHNTHRQIIIMLIQDRTCIEAIEYLCYTDSDQNWAFITPNLTTPSPSLI